MQVVLHSEHCILSTIFLVVLACGREHKQAAQYDGILEQQRSLQHLRTTHLLVEDGLGLTTITGLLAVVTPLTCVFK